MKRKLTKKWFFWFVSGLTLLLFLSAGTKHYWYIAPLVPLFAGLIAISIYYLFEKIQHARFNFTSPCTTNGV